MANYCILHRGRLLGETTKQLLSKLEPWIPWKYKNLSGLRPDSSSSKKLRVMLVTFDFTSDSWFGRKNNKRTSCS